MPSRSRNLEFWRDELKFLKESLLIISFLKTGKVTEKVRNVPLSIKFIFLNVLLLSILRAILEIIHWTHKYPSQRWDLINLGGFIWQIAVFIIFIIPFSSYILSYASSYLAHVRISFSQIFNVYFYLTFLFAISPIFDIIASFLGAPSFFFLPFTNESIITMGQLIEAFILPILSFLILHQITHSTRIAIISTLIMGLLFPFILIGPDGVYYMSFIFNFNGHYWLPNDPFHIILWAMENLWFSLLMVILLSTYLLRKLRQLNLNLNRFNILLGTFLGFSVLIGYFLGNQAIPLPHLLALVLSLISCWIMYVLLKTRYVCGEVQLNDWVITISLFWLITIGLSFTLVVSFFSFFILLAIILIIFIYIYYLKSITFQSSKVNKKKYVFYFLICILMFLSILLGATPTIFYYIEYSPGNFYHHIPLEVPNPIIFLGAVPCSFILNLIFYYLNIKKSGWGLK
ncbi:MAG: hypothetical protein ACTSRS_19255 [Candidatus Helarchaeota archaeon]